MWGYWLTILEVLELLYWKRWCWGYTIGQHIFIYIIYIVCIQRWRSTMSYHDIMHITCVSFTLTDLTVKNIVWLHVPSLNPKADWCHPIRRRSVVCWILRRKWCFERPKRKPNRLWTIHFQVLPSRKLTYPTWGNHLQNGLLRGYVSSQEGNYVGFRDIHTHLITISSIESGDSWMYPYQRIYMGNPCISPL